LNKLIFNFRRVKSKIAKRFDGFLMDYGREILDNEKGSEVIFNALKEDKPLFVGRLGAGEMRMLEFYLSNWDFEVIKKMLENNTGFFPSTNENIKKLAKEYIEALKKVDILGVWYNPLEDFVVKKFAKDAILVTSGAIHTPFFAIKPWSEALKGKKVLVIHPFSESIKKQYQKRELLFKNPKILPEFELDVLKAVQTIAGNRDERFKTWFEALEYMKKEIEKRDFDIAIIGAGAYGFPLGAFVKSLGKKAIHMGGSTQLLFGIKGKRWDERNEFKRLFNKHWIRPIEKPKNFKRVENGCYW